MAFGDELAQLDTANTHFYFDDGIAGRGIDLQAVLAPRQVDTDVYVCGPRGMIEATRQCATALGWGTTRVHFEVFGTQKSRAGDREFTVELRNSGRVLTVPAHQTILEVLIDAGLDPLYDCKRGECGICETGVMDGEVDHRDFVLSDRQRTTGRKMCICVSRAKAGTLLLDL